MADLNGDPGACDVCGRSMLAGERTRTYLTRDREEREVCDLCVVRAESAGWVARELAGTAAPERREVGGAVRRLFGRARDGAGGRVRATGGTTEGEAEPRGENGDRPPPPERQRPKRDPEPAKVASEPAERARPRRRSVPQKPERRIKRALELFNSSEHTRTVRGLIRSLGGPYVSAATSDDSPAEVRITVAWELSWYQYDVDLASEDGAVRELGRGDELGQLSAADQAWNAHAAEDGELRPGLVGSDAGA